MHAAAVAWTLAGFFLLALSFLGWGRFALRLLATNAPEDSEAATILLGWAFAVLILQVLNLVLPITSWVAVPLIGIGLVLSFPDLRRRVAGYGWERVPSSLVVVAIAFVVIAAWVASRSMFRVQNFDSGLYHFPTIRWLNTYGIVPGLGNLHGRLAFNQSFFSYAAALNASWFQDHARSAANSFLYVVVLFQATAALWRRWRDRNQRDEPNALRWAPEFLTLPALVYIGLSSDGLNSPTPDLAATLLQLAMFLILARAIAEWSSGGEFPKYAAVMLPFLAATAITVKLSTIAFSASIIAICLLAGARPALNSSAFLRHTVVRLVPAGVVIAVWMARGIILSGCPLYPSTTGCLDVDWAVPLEKIVHEADWIYSWARDPGAEPRVVLGHWGWLEEWSARQLKDFLGFVFPLAVGAALIMSALALRFRRTSASATPIPRRDFIILIPMVLGILFWFFTAPDPRFGRAFFWMLSVSGALLLLRSLEGTLTHSARPLVMMGLFMTVNAPFLAYMGLKGKSRVTMISTAGWQPLPQPRLVSRPTSSGLTLYVPEAGEKCWDGALPCTPYFNPYLSLRAAGRLERGFIDRSASRNAEAAPHP